MNDSEKQVVEFVQNMETVTLGRWMVNMQNLSSRLPSNSKKFPHLCIRVAARELKNRLTR